MKLFTAITLTVFSGSSLVNAQLTDTLFKSSGNPIITHKYTADAAAIVHNNKVYLYTGHDVAPPKENRVVLSVVCI
jgi:hypothetical protein